MDNKDFELTNEELTEKLQKAENKLEELTQELSDLKQGQALLQNTVIRLAMKLVGTL